MSLVSTLGQLMAWLSSCWRGQAYFLLDAELQRERGERQALWELFQEERAKSEAEIKRLNDDRVLLVRGVIPERLRPTPKPPTQREFGPDGAIAEAIAEKERRREQMRIAAEEWKASLNGNSNHDTEDDTVDEELEA